MRVNSTYEVNISKNTNRCLRGNVFEKYREWEAQEVYIEGLTFCNLDEMETHGQKLKKNKFNVWLLPNMFGKKPNTLVSLHLGAIFHTCLDFDTYVWEKAHMCEKSHTIICLQMFAIFHTCVGKATDMLISPWAMGDEQSATIATCLSV